MTMYEIMNKYNITESTLKISEVSKKLNISKSSWYRRVRERQRSAGNQSSE